MLFQGSTGTGQPASPHHGDPSGAACLVIDSLSTLLLRYPAEQAGGRSCVKLPASSSSSAAAHLGPPVPQVLQWLYCLRQDTRLASILAGVYSVSD